MEKALNAVVESYMKSVGWLWRNPLTKIPFAIAVAPWCVVSWLGAAAIYFISGTAKRDTSGDIGLAVMAAPVYVPIMPFTIALGALRKRRERLKQERLAAAVAWISARLVGVYGIRLKTAEERYGRVAVEAFDLTPEQAEAFRQVYAGAAVRFPDLSLVELCAYAQPLHLLDAAWATQHGLGAHAEERFTGPCEDCGSRRSLGYFLTGDRIGEDLASSLEPPRCIRYADGTSRHLDGHLCEACLNRKPWKSMGSCFCHHD